MYAPLSGTVVGVNEALGQGGKASLINSSPYQDGWIGRIEVSSAAAEGGSATATAFEGLMDEAAYVAHTKGE